MCAYIEEDLFQCRLRDGIVEDHLFNARISFDCFKERNDLSIPAMHKG